MIKFFRFRCQLVRLHRPWNGVVPEEAAHWASQWMRFLWSIKEWRDLKPDEDSNDHIIKEKPSGDLHRFPNFGRRL